MDTPTFAEFVLKSSSYNTRPYTDDEIRRHRNNLARTLLKDCIEVTDNWQEFTVTAEDLNCFLAEPHSHTPELTSDMKLDTTASMARDMRRSPWNQTIVLVIAAKASQLATNNPEYYGGDTEHSSWQKLISDRLYKIFLDVEKAKKGTRDHDYEAQKQRSKRRRVRQYVRLLLNFYCSLGSSTSAYGRKTHERRIQIATVMITVMENLGNEEEYIRWSEILYSLDQLGVAGTSDSEDILDTRGQQGVIIYEPNFRHGWFRTLFHELDKLPETAHHLFSNVGRKRLPRICGNERVERPPPANIPASYFQPEYLDKMEKGLTPTVVPTQADRPLPRLPNLQFILSQVNVGSEDLLE